jgi:RecB family exonuclease
MNGEFDLKAPEHMAFEGSWMLRLIKSERDDPKQLAGDLEKFAPLICAPAGLELHLARARALLGGLISSLQQVREIPWQELIGRVAPERVTIPSGSMLSREGITVFTEREEPWRRVRHLLVLGFEAGRYPAEPPRNGIFSETDLTVLGEKLGYDIETGAAVNARRRSLFRRQLNCADERITFLLPRLDTSGKRLLPSQTLTFMAILFKGIHEPEELILELDTSYGRKHARELSLAPPLGPIPPRPLKVADLSMECDLLKLRCYDDGTPKPQSPSRLEALMVSPFHWLLEMGRLLPLEWVPESLDVASKGTLAHDVFEHLFQPGVPLPSAREIMESVPGLLNQAIIRKRPFLLRSEWHVERRHLQHDIEVAATRWSEMLGEIGARVLGNEVRLKGKLDDLPIRGNADLLIALPKGRLYVVDYKKSGSKARLERMKKGYDSQASLYRLMLETGGDDNRKNEALAAALDAKTEIGVLYYLLNDQVALADSPGWMANSVVGLEELGSGISTNAMIRIRSRIDEVRTGKVALNSEADEDWYEKNAGIKIYSLDNSPLLRLFMHPAPEESE